MPYAIKYVTPAKPGDEPPPAQYVVRPVNGQYKRKRRLTTNLNEATVWVKPGHAKNAIREMFTMSPGLVPAKATLEIVLVNYTEGPVAARVQRKKDRYGTVRTQDVV